MYNEAYVGKSYAQLIEEFGAPSRTTPDGLGGTILIYEDVTISSTGYVSRYGSANMTSSKDVEFIHFYVDSSNNCYKTKSRFKRSELNTGLTVATVAGCLFVFLLPAMAGNQCAR